MSTRIAVDRIRCDGRGVCAELFPEAITLDDWGYPVVAPGGIAGPPPADGAPGGVELPGDGAAPRQVGDEERGERPDSHSRFPATGHVGVRLARHPSRQTAPPRRIDTPGHHCAPSRPDPPPTDARRPRGSIHPRFGGTTMADSFDSLNPPGSADMAPPPPPPPPPPAAPSRRQVIGRKGAAMAVASGLVVGGVAGGYVISQAATSTPAASASPAPAAPHGFAGGGRRRANPGHAAGGRRRSASPPRSCRARRPRARRSPRSPRSTTSTRPR